MHNSPVNKTKILLFFFIIIKDLITVFSQFKIELQSVQEV